MNFKKWIKQAYGVEHDDYTARFTVFNMEVAYESREREVDELLTALQAAFKALDAISDEMTVGERYTNAGQYLIDVFPVVREALEKHGGKE